MAYTHSFFSFICLFRWCVCVCGDGVSVYELVCVCVCVCWCSVNELVKENEGGSHVVNAFYIHNVATHHPRTKQPQFIINVPALNYFRETHFKRFQFLSTELLFFSISVSSSTPLPSCLSWTCNWPLQQSQKCRFVTQRWPTSRHGFSWCSCLWRCDETTDSRKWSRVSSNILISRLFSLLRIYSSIYIYLLLFEEKILWSFSPLSNKW
jgi:hypothetical protein